MTTCVYSPADLQKMAELEREQAAGAGATPNYLIADRGQFKPEEIADSAAISGAAFTSTGINSALASSEKPPVSLDTEDPQYLKNSLAYQDAIYGRPSSSASPPPADDSSDFNNIIDQINALDGELSDMVMGFDEDDYTIDAEGGYSSVDAESLEAWAQQMIARLNVLMGLLIALSTFFETKWLVDEILSDIPREEGKNSAKEAFSRRARFFLKLVNVAVTNVFKKVNQENMARYNERAQELKEEANSTGAKIEAILTGGDSSEDLSQAMLTETENYLNATNATLEALQQVINLIIASLMANAAASDEFSIFFLGMVSSLQKFNQKIEEMQAKIDENLQEALEAYEEYSAEHDFLDDINSGLPGVLIGQSLNPIGWWIWAIDKWTNTDFADNLINPSEELDVEGLIDEYRGQLVGMQNAFRLYLSLQFLKRDLRNLVRSQFTSLTGLSNNADLLMISAEASLGNAVAMFDMTTTQLMFKTSLQQSAVDLLRGIRQLQKAKPLYTLAVAAIVVAVVIAVIITVFSVGTLTAPVILGLVALVLAIGGAASKAFLAAAESRMNDVTLYSPVEADYSSVEEKKGVGQTVIDVLERLEQAEKSNLAAAAKNKDLMIITKDGYYTFDTEAFALYQMRQTALDNAIRSVFDIVKNARNLKRMVRAIFTGSTFSDSGAALLQNAVENVLSQKQMLLSAIKFQQQQVISAKNIARQKELASINNTKDVLVNVAGAVVSILLYFIPGIGSILSIGMQLAISVYNFVDAGWGIGNGRNLDLESPSDKEIRKLLKKKGEESVEAKLDQAELDAYLDALSGAILVNAGDGYVSVDVSAVTSIYDRLGRIYAAKEALAKARALKSELLAIVREQMSGVSTQVTGSLTQSVNQANFGTAMQVMGDLVSFQNARADILNRARDAEKKFILATITMGINAAAFILASLTQFVKSFGSFVKSVTKMEAKAFVGIIGGVTSLVNSIVQLVASGRETVQGLGAYENYNVKTTVDRTSKKTTNARTIDEKLDKMEYEILLQMNQDLIATLDGPYQGVSAGSTRLSYKMQQLYNIKEAIAIARSIATAARRAAGQRILTGDFGQDSIEEKEAVATALLDSLKSALEAIISRENQISAAQKGMLLSGISVGLSAVTLAFNIAATKAESERLVYTDKSSTTSVNGAVPSAPQEAVTAGITTPDATSATGSTNPGSISTDQPGKNQKGQESQEEAKRHAENKFAKKAFVFNTISGLLSFASSVMNVVVSAGYDETANSKAEKAGTKEERAANRETKSGKAQEKSLDSNSEGNIFSYLDSYDAEIADLNYDLALTQNLDTASAYIAARNQQWVDSVMPWIKESINQIHSIVSGKAKLTYIIGSDKKVEGAVPATDVMAGASAAAGKIAPEAITGRPETFIVQEKNTPSTKALLDYADQIEAAGKTQAGLAEEAQKAQAAIAMLASKRRELAEKIEQPAPPITAKAKVAIEAEIKALEQQILEKRQQLDELIKQNQAVLEEVKRLEAGKPRLMEAARREVVALKGRMDALCREITELETRGMQSLTAEEKLRLEQLTAEKETLKGQINLAEETQKAVDEGRRLQAIQQKAKEIKAQIDATKSGLQVAQKQLAGLRNLLARSKKNESEKSKKAAEQKVKKDLSIQEKYQIAVCEEEKIANLLRGVSV